MSNTKIYPAQEIVASAQEMLEKGDIQEAFNQFKNAALQKNPQAHYALAKFYDQNLLQMDVSETDARLATCKEHLRKAVNLGYFPEELIALLNKTNDKILREMLKKALQKPFESRDLKSFNSLLTFLKVDVQMREDFNLLYEKADQEALNTALKSL